MIMLNSKCRGGVCINILEFVEFDKYIVLWFLDKGMFIGGDFG